MKRTTASFQALDARRRAFLQTLTTMMAALAVARCGGGGGGSDPQAPAPGPAPASGINVPPVWTTIPTVAFTQGIASSFSLASFVNDPNGDSLALTMNALTLPPGVTFDAVDKRLVYDGIG